ncbi:trichohyalin-like [Macrobrachium nipponense]|uniref:trichohyalin-like n=1 Tax=Macrobrachium nipponense TaxID=159736 RepID=UPI0030C8C60D
MGTVKERVFARMQQPRSYGRYIDDIFVQVDTEDEVEAFHQAFQQYSVLNYTVEHSFDDRLPFLNVLVSKTEDGLIDQGTCESHIPFGEIKEVRWYTSGVRRESPHRKGLVKPAPAVERLKNPSEGSEESGATEDKPELAADSETMIASEFTIRNPVGGVGERIKSLYDINQATDNSADPKDQLLTMRKFYEDYIQQQEEEHQKEIQQLENQVTRLCAALQDKNKYLRQAKKDAKAKNSGTLPAADNEELVLGLKQEMARLAQESTELRRQREMEHDQYEETILGLKREVQVLADDNQKMKREMEDQQSGLLEELSRLQDGNKEKEMKIDLLEKNLQLLQDENGPHLEEKQRKEIEALESKCSRLLKANEDKNVFLRQAKKDMKRLRQEIEDKQTGLMEELKRLQNENTEKEMKIVLLETEKMEESRKVVLLETTVANLEHLLKTQERQGLVMEEEIVVLKEDIAKLEDEKKQLESNLALSRLEMDTIATQKNKENEMKTDLLEKDKQRKEIEALENKCSRLLKAMKDKNVYLRQAKKDMKRLRQEIEDKQTGLMEELNRLQNENSEKEMKIVLLETEKMEESRKVVLLETTVANLEHHLKTQERQGLVMEEEIVVLKEDIARLEDEKKQLESNLALSRLELDTIVTQREGPNAHPNDQAPGISHQVEEEEDREPDSTAKRAQEDGASIENEGRDTPKYRRLLSEIRNLKRGQKQLREQLLEGRKKYEELESIALSLQRKNNRKDRRRKRRDWFQKRMDNFQSYENESGEETKLPRPADIAFSQSERCRSLMPCECGDVCEGESILTEEDFEEWLRAKDIEIAHTIMAKEGDIFFMVQKKRKGPDLEGHKLQRTEMRRQKRETIEEILIDKLEVRFREMMEERLREIEERVEVKIRKRIKKEIEKENREIMEKIIKEKIQEMCTEETSENYIEEAPGKEMEIMTEEKKKEKEKEILGKIWKRQKKRRKEITKRLEMYRKMRRRLRERQAERRTELVRKLEELALEKFIKENQPAMIKRKGKKQR